LSHALLLAFAATYAMITRGLHGNQAKEIHRMCIAEMWLIKFHQQLLLWAIPESRIGVLMLNCYWI
jgi:hypothetical protein